MWWWLTQRRQGAKLEFVGASDPTNALYRCRSRDWYGHGGASLGHAIKLQSCQGRHTNRLARSYCGSAHQGTAVASTTAKLRLDRATRGIGSRKDAKARMMLKRSAGRTLHTTGAEVATGTGMAALRLAMPPDAGRTLNTALSFCRSIVPPALKPDAPNAYPALKCWAIFDLSLTGRMIGITKQTGVPVTTQRRS